MDGIPGLVLITALAFVVIGVMVVLVASSRAKAILGIRDDGGWLFSPGGAKIQGLVVAYVGAIVAVGAAVFLVADLVATTLVLPWALAWIAALGVGALTLAPAVGLGRRLVNGPGTAGRRRAGPEDRVRPPILDDALDDIDLVNARRSAEAGDWTPAAALLRATGDHDIRHQRIMVLAAAAARRSVWLESWLTARPDDPHAAVVRAAVEVLRAWEARSGDAAKDVNEQQFRDFLIGLESAEELAKRAAMLAPDDPSPWVLLVEMARGQQIDQDEFSRRLERGLEIDPDNLAIHQAALQTFAPKWLGSTELMFEYVTEATKDVPIGSPLNLLVATAHLEEWCSRSMTNPMRAEIYMSGAKVSASIAAAERAWLGAPGGPSPIGALAGHNMMAVVWHIVGDSAKTRVHLEAMGGLLTRWPWEYLDEPETSYRRVAAWCGYTMDHVSDGPAKASSSGTPDTDAWGQNSTVA